MDGERSIPTQRGTWTLYTARTPCTARVSHAAWDTDARAAAISFQRDEGDKRRQSWRVPAIPLRQAGPRLTNTLQAPGHNPFTGNGIGWNPQGWPSPQRPPHLS